MIGCSGATIRRWEARRGLPDWRDMDRIADVCRLTPLQHTVLTLVFSRIHILTPPVEDVFREHARRILSHDYPAVIWDSLLYQRAWNSHVEALAPGSDGRFTHEDHPVAIMLRTFDRHGGDDPRERQHVIKALQLFWLSTAYLAHRPEYGELIRKLRVEPRFEEFWLGLSTTNESPVLEPLGFAHVIARGGGRFRVNSRVIAFPASYLLYEYVPDDDESWQRLRELRKKGPPEVRFASRHHWAVPPRGELQETSVRQPEGR